MVYKNSLVRHDKFMEFFMEGQETRDLGAKIVQHGYKLSFITLYGHSRLDRPNEKLRWVYVRLPTHPLLFMFEKWLVM